MYVHNEFLIVVYAFQVIWEKANYSLWVGPFAYDFKLSAHLGIYSHPLNADFIQFLEVRVIIIK